MQYKVFRLNSLTLLMLLSTSAAGKAEIKDTEDLNRIERIEVQGQALADRSTMTEETQTLLKVAGIMNDPLAAVYSLPGVVFGGSDYGSLPAVRGSSPQDNAYLIDGLPAGYLFHLFGNSVLNEKLLHDFRFDAAAFGPQYGNSTGGVFEAVLRDPQFEPIGGEGELSMLQMGMLLEGEISSQQAFYLAARQSTLQYVIEEDKEYDEGVKFYQPPRSHDYQARYLFQLNDAQQLSLTLIGAADKAKANISKTSEQGRTDPESVGDARVDTAFEGQRLAYQWQPDHKRQLSLQYQRSKQEEDNLFGQNQFIRYVDERNSLLLGTQWQLSPEHRLLAGGELSKREGKYQFDAIPYYCTDHQQDCFEQRGDRLQADDRLEYRSSGVYLQHQWQLHPQWLLLSGLRSDRQDYTDESYLQPRMELHFRQNDELAWFVRGGRYSRQADLEKSLPLLGNRWLQQPLANHYVVGNQWELNADWQLRSELYLKQLTQLPLALTTADADQALHYSNQTSGRALGAELLLKKKPVSSVWSGWASLSWSAAERTNERSGQTNEYLLDTPLVFNLVVMYPAYRQWDLSARLTVRSGARYTPITGTKANPYHPGYLVATYGDLNSGTLPVYHRLDLQAEREGSLAGLSVTYTLAILNVLNRRNVSGYYLLNAKSGESQQYSIEPEENLGILPAAGITVRF